MAKQNYEDLLVDCYLTSTCQEKEVKNNQGNTCGQNVPNFSDFLDGSYILKSVDTQIPPGDHCHTQFEYFTLSQNQTSATPHCTRLKQHALNSIISLLTILC